MLVILSAQEIEILRRPNNGEGGFQTLMRRLNQNLDPTTNGLSLSTQDLEQIPRYAFDYNQGGWEDRLRGIFLRHLGAQLGR